ncbi:MAG: hypothetical protein CVV22_11510 [Ignavibacteriae bacterium HGW-Ignavibacteriae-1]|jgi:hypothetical protein|nr:MAG: hypothetical protein CVV22_11510 [Ignavibacteriae bacterium HGW-Ignavibacteriae-1]
MYLTESYKDLFKQRNLATLGKALLMLPKFVRDVIRSGKTEELSSFMLWEIKHQLGLFGKSKYLKLSKQSSYEVEALENSLNEVFVNSDSRKKVKKSAYKWWKVFHKGNLLVGALFESKNQISVVDRESGTITHLTKFDGEVMSVFVSSENIIYVCTLGFVYRGTAKSEFVKVVDYAYRLSYFRNNCGMTELPDGTLIVCEYGVLWENGRWVSLAYLYISRDNGVTWKATDFLIKDDVNKHVHLVKYLKNLNKLCLTDGDNHKRLRFNDTLLDLESIFRKSDDDGWRTINKHHVGMGGHTAVVEYGNSVFFGSDYLGGTNFMIRTDDSFNFVYQVLPDPFRRNAISHLITKNGENGVEIWAFIADLGNFNHTKGMIMYSSDSGQSWSQFFEYDGNDYVIEIVSAADEVVDTIFISLTNKVSGAYTVIEVL